MAIDEPKTETKTDIRGDWYRRNRLPMIVGGILLAGLIFVAGAVAGRVGMRARALLNGNGVAAITRDGGFHSHMRGGLGGKLGSGNEQRLMGAVTSVSDTELKIAGGGATNTIKLTSSTQYTNGTKAAVNDSVIVFGTTNNGTFTATRVVINP